MRDRKWIASIPLAVFFAIGATGAGAAGWELASRASVSQSYTDNLSLADAGREEEHITSVNAGLSLSRESRASELALSYDVVGVRYWNTGRRNQVYHRFFGNSTVELLREHLFLDADASYTQRLTDSRDGVPLDLLTPSRNRADVATYRISPYLQERFGRFALGEARYAYEKTEYAGSRLDDFDSETDHVSASLVSGSMFTTIGWNASYRRDEIVYGDGSEIVFDILEGQVSWNLGRSLSVFVSGGRERNEFEFDPVRRPRPDDDFWRAGFTWTPGSRTTMTAYYGERFFGETYGGSLTHRSRNTSWSLEYTESPSTTSSVVFTPVLGLIETPTGDVFLIELEIPELFTEVYLARRFTAAVSGARVRTGWRLRLYSEEREYQLRPENDQRTEGVGLNAWMRLAARTTVTLETRLQRNQYREDDREDDLWAASLALTRQFSQRVNTSLSYRHQARDSNLPGNDYRENRITATASISF